MGDLIEIRWHGRGGQGVVTASKLLAEAALEEDKYFQGLPDYGAERMGAPIRAFTRISSKPIVSYCQVTEPDVVVVLDSTLFGVVDLTEGLKKDGILLINSSASPGVLRSQSGYKGKVYSVDATAISMELLGRNLPNTPMLGALARVTCIVSKESLAREIRSKLGATMKGEIVAANISAFEKAYASVQGD
ncbi:MAG: 2-oxoacid:acceptor oxidoreductase family protein [Dehalococcoidia bacterium]|nr:2-oxoacid:acceptor oxidoreductase family protein [Dehalococcoidia bacterium]